MNPTKSDALPDFHPSTVIRDWGEGQALRIEDALTGISVFGATGSGKSSGPGRNIAMGYLAADFGGLVLCSKPEERHVWEGWARECGREQDLVIVDKSGRWRFNVLDWEASRSGEGAGMTTNIVALLKEIAHAVKGTESKGGGGDSKFFDDALEHMEGNLVELILFSGLRLSLGLMRDIVLSGPQNLDEAHSEAWREQSVCAAVLREAAANAERLDADMQSDFEECRAYWEVEFPSTSFKTRSIFTLMFSMLTRNFTTRPLSKLFSSDTNVTPEMMFNGRIFIINLPVQEFKLCWDACESSVEILLSD